MLVCSQRSNEKFCQNILRRIGVVLKASSILGNPSFLIAQTHCERWPIIFAVFFVNAPVKATAAFLIRRTTLGDKSLGRKDASCVLGSTGVLIYGSSVRRHRSTNWRLFI